MTGGLAGRVPVRRNQCWHQSFWFLPSVVGRLSGHRCQGKNCWKIVFAWNMQRESCSLAILSWDPLNNFYRNSGLHLWFSIFFIGRMRFDAWGWVSMMRKRPLSTWQEDFSDVWLLGKIFTASEMFLSGKLCWRNTIASATLQKNLWPSMHCSVIRTANGMSTSTSLALFRKDCVFKYFSVCEISVPIHKKCVETCVYPYCVPKT